ncbi:MAG: NUDIX domain-containing protein [Verrucomicrobia bacterium]|nr:NUDIX domain-containing protein [Verrucomicrobiota bacterium]
MKQEHSCGVVPLKKEGSNIYVLLIVHKGGKHWGFPKGHKDPGESDQQTAERELREETGLSISRFLSKKPYIETYTFYKFHQKIHKKVSYFPAFVEGELVLQLDEIIDSRWISIDQADRHLTFKEAKEICNKVITLLQAERLL